MIHSRIIPKTTGVGTDYSEIGLAKHQSRTQEAPDGPAVCPLVAGEVQWEGTLRTQGSTPYPPVRRAFHILTTSMAVPAVRKVPVEHHS